MRPNKAWASWLVAALLAGGAWVFVRIYLYSSESGSVFPRYSSLRSDPVGAKALHDSLAALPGLTVRRWFKPLGELKGDDAVVFFLGDQSARWFELTGRDLTAIEDRMNKGLRLVVALQPSREKPSREASLVEKRWKFKIQRGRTIEIPRGKGSIVFLPDSFPFSNEALRDRRQSELIASAIGTYRNIVFDEFHLGTVQTGSIGALLRHFHLEPAAGVLILLGLLFVWRSTSSFVPPPRQDAASAIAGRDSTAALTSLLRRGVPPGQLPATALELWRKSVPMQPAVSAAQRAGVETELSNPNLKDLPGLWNRIHRVLHTRT
jgi:hypothetical protein